MPIDVGGNIISDITTREYEYRSIISSGLVLHLDASMFNTISGTSWFDFSGLGNTGTLVNSPTFNSSNLGYLAFNGSNTHVTIPNNTALDTQTPSVEVWVKTNNTNQNGFWFEKGVVNTQYSLFQEGTSIVWRQASLSQYTTTSTYLNTTDWAHIVGTYQSGERKTYINGTLVTSDAQTGTVLTNSGGMSIGVYGGLSGARGYYYSGHLSIVRVYNRVLTASEVLHNYNINKHRYGH